MEHVKDHVHPDTHLTETEIAELQSIFDANGYFDDDKYDYVGNHLLTTDPAVHRSALGGLCCGIFGDDVVLGSGKRVYISFDYGH